MNTLIPLVCETTFLKSSVHKTLYTRLCTQDGPVAGTQNTVGVFYHDSFNTDDGFLD